MSKHIRVTVFEEDGSSYDLVDTRGEPGVEIVGLARETTVEGQKPGAIHVRRKPGARHALRAEWLTVPTSAGGPGPRAMPVVKKGSR
jgi:hypothetical protein